ncbi:MAG: Lrp/AsnC ligand binding domain-containing protein, partial [Thermoplasmatales archaeon]|nr:Lrp/AsnC ligand binding domain-containing protein [Thermoplasmatales archaeon]
MTVGFVLIKNKPGSEFWVYGRLLNEPEIKEVYPIFGEYDFLVKMVAGDFEAIGKVVINKIRIIDGVIDTITLTEAQIPKP